MRGEPHRWEITFGVSLGDVRWGAAGVGHEMLVHGWKMPAQLYQSFSTEQHTTKREFTTGCEDASLTVSRGRGAILLAGRYPACKSGDNKETYCMDTFQVNNRRLWVDSTPNSSISVVSTDKHGSGTTEAYMPLMENTGIYFRVPTLGTFNFRCAGTARKYSFIS
jgi:hypothetical protein